MEYVVKEIKETVDFLELTEDEFNSINDLFYNVVASKYPNLEKFRQIGDVKKCILTDEFSRVEFLIKVKSCSESFPSSKQEEEDKSQQQQGQKITAI
jgi:hypothetical protein